VGELRWEEVRSVKVSKSSGGWQFVWWHHEVNQSVPGIVLKVAGATIVIADIYDRPIALIYQNICHYWRGESQDEERPTARQLFAEEVRLPVSDTTLPRSSDGVTTSE